VSHHNQKKTRNEGPVPDFSVQPWQAVQVLGNTQQVRRWELDGHCFQASKTPAASTLNH